MVEQPLEEALRDALHTRMMLMPDEPPADIRNRLGMLRRCLQEMPDLDTGPATLLVRAANAVECHPLRDPTSIGAAPGNDIVVAGEYVSRRHAAVRRAGAGWLLEDAQSTNGIYANGRRVTQHVLRDGDVLQIGTVTCFFLSEATAAPNEPCAQVRDNTDTAVEGSRPPA